MEGGGRGGVPAPRRAALICPMWVEDAVMPGAEAVSREIGRREGTDAGWGLVVDKASPSEALWSECEGDTPGNGCCSVSIV